MFEEKCRRLDERCRVLEERSRSSDDYLKGSSGEKQQMEQKLLAALEEVGRLHTRASYEPANSRKLSPAWRRSCSVSRGIRIWVSW